MAEITRETLELAALAAGHEIVCALDDLIGPGPAADAACGAVLLRGVQNSWRPHLDDGDAARLAARLNMHQQLGSIRGMHFASTSIPSRLDSNCACSVQHDGTEPNKLRAWREAVTLCAAAVGERMRGER